MPLLRRCKAFQKHYTEGGLCLKSGFRHKKAQEAQMIFLSFLCLLCLFVAAVLTMIGLLRQSPEGDVFTTIWGTVWRAT